MQGFNMGRYIPPSALDAGLSANQASGKGHALGARARKSHLGILTVRFEMPFAIWCSTCPESSNNRLIGQGVRFNAEKKKVGNYYSTPIWCFRMKHVSCGGWLELRTDPKTSDFVVTEGAKRRDTGGDIGIGLQLKEEDEREKKRNDAFSALEVKVDDKRVAKNDAHRIEELKSLKERDWNDTYSASQKLRRSFRAGRKTREKDAQATEALQDKMSLGIDLVDESEGDRARAELIDFGSVSSGTGGDATLRAKSRPLFTAADNEQGSRKNKNQDKSRTRVLQQELAQNTRVAMDPFLTSSNNSDKTHRRRTLPGIKKKGVIANTDSPEPSTLSSAPERLKVPPETADEHEESSVKSPTGILVGYDSD